MKLLLLDIGNTYTKIAVYDKKINLIGNVLSKDIISSFDSFKLEFDDVIISSVKPELDNELRLFMLNKYGIEAKFVNHNMKFNIEYPKEKNELGSDLICLMEGCSKYDNSFIASSFGTASVILYVENNIFKGCAIAPGLLTSLNGLISNASLIKDTILDGKYNLLGMDTNESLRTGTYNSFKYIVDGFISSIKKEYNVNPPIYFFGGHSLKIYELSDFKDKILINQNLIFEGLVDIYRGNYE